MSIPFKALLYKICSHLGFAAPTFHPFLLCVHNCFVVVVPSNKPTPLVYYGGQQSSIEKSVEAAAKKMVLFLVKRYKLRINDMNLGVLDDIEQLCADFRLKRRRFECVESGESLGLTEPEQNLEVVESSPAALSIDFYLLLADVIERLNIHVTKVEYFHFGSKCYKACLSVATPTSVTKSRWIQSGRCSSIYAAKQTLAKRVLEFFKPIYQFEVEDVNYHMLKCSSVHTMLERETCLTMKERIHGIKEDFSATAVLDEEVPVTL